MKDEAACCSQNQAACCPGAKVNRSYQWRFLQNRLDAIITLLVKIRLYMKCQKNSLEVGIEEVNAEHAPCNKEAEQHSLHALNAEDVCRNKW